MKPQIRIAFSCFWHGFSPAVFQGRFPYLYEKYDLVVSPDPEVLFYSVFPPDVQYGRDPRYRVPEAGTAPLGNYLRVFFTGENVEPAMEACEYAITFSRLTDHPNHLRLPLWVYENRGWRGPLERLVKNPTTDWEAVARTKTGFCNFVYSHSLPFREKIFHLFNSYKRVDSAGHCLNNMEGWCVPMEPNRFQAKCEFLARYKFTLAIESWLWPGYQTEKLVDPMYANSVPIYFGDPHCAQDFNPDSYIDFSRFASIREVLEFVRALDNDSALYTRMLATPFFRDNQVPEFATDAAIMAFFDRIFAHALARRGDHHEAPPTT